MAKKVTVSCFTEVTSLTATYHSEATSLVRSNCPEATSSVEQAPARHAAVGASTPGASTPRRGLALHSAGTRQQSHSQRRRSDKGSLVSCKRQGRAGQLRQPVGRSSTVKKRELAPTSWTSRAGCWHYIVPCNRHWKESYWYGKRQGRAGQLRQSVGRSSTFVVRQ